MNVRCVGSVSSFLDAVLDVVASYFSFTASVIEAVVECDGQAGALECPDTVETEQHSRSSPEAIAFACSYPVCNTGRQT